MFVTNWEARRGRVVNSVVLGLAGTDAAVCGGDDVLAHSTDTGDLATVEETLRILLDGVGTLEVV